jgi:hypothetical protein
LKSGDRPCKKAWDEDEDEDERRDDDDQSFW